MIPPEIPSAVPPLDLNAIDALRSLGSGDDSFLHTLIRVYLESTPVRIAEIEEALAQADAGGLTRAAHRLKSTSANFGAIRLRAASEKIELLGRQGALAEVPPFLATLKTEFAALRPALEALLLSAGAKTDP